MPCTGATYNLHHHCAATEKWCYRVCFMHLPFHSICDSFLNFRPGQSSGRPFNPAWPHNWAWTLAWLNPIPPSCWEPQRRAGAVVSNSVMDIRARTIRSQAYFKDQRLISGSCRRETLGMVKGALIIKNCAGKRELPRPVDRPVSRQVVLVGQAAHGQVAGGGVHLLELDAARAGRHRHHRVVVCEERGEQRAGSCHTRRAGSSFGANLKLSQLKRHTAVLTHQVTPFSPGKTSSDFNTPCMQSVIRVTARCFNSWFFSLWFKARKSKFTLEKCRTH